MTKSDLIEHLAKELDIPLTNAGEVLRVFFDELRDALVRGERIEIRGFGSFSIRQYRSYVGQNPKTGEKIEVQPKRLPFFKVGKELKERLNEE